jgi:hypothetical protein
MNTSNFFIGTAMVNPPLSTDPHVAAGRARVGACSAVVAVRKYQDYRGQVAYQVTDVRMCAPADLAETERELRRDLVRLAEHEPVKPSTSSFVLANIEGQEVVKQARTSAEAIEAMYEREAAEEAAAKAELARLDKAGSHYVAKSSGEPNLQRLAQLLKANRITAASFDERQPLHWVREALDGGLPVGVLGMALARAITAAG